MLPLKEFLKVLARVIIFAALLVAVQLLFFEECRSAILMMAVGMAAVLSLTVFITLSVDMAEKSYREGCNKNDHKRDL